MCKLDHVKLTGTTASDGSLTVTDSTVRNGTLKRVEWIDGDLADGVGFALSVTGTPSGVDQTLLTVTNANNDANYYPHEPADDNAGADVTFDGTNEIYVKPVFWGNLKLVVSSGGDTKTGGCVVYYRH